MSNHAMNASMKEACAVEIQLEELFKLACVDSPQRWNAIRKIHSILDQEERDDPYPVDWTRIFTPIERNAWSEFRYLGIPMLPQYPIARFFVDFANIEKRIVFECDGKHYHDKEKDFQRDLVCSEHGWVVFRATGAECKRYLPPPWEKHETKEEISADIDGARNWLNTTSDGLIYAISIFFFKDKPTAYPFTDADIRYRLEMASNTFSTMYPGGF